MVNVGDSVEGMIKFQAFNIYEVEVAFTRAYFNSQGNFEYNLAAVPPSQYRISGVRIDSEIFQTTNDPTSTVAKYINGALVVSSPDGIPDPLAPGVFQAIGPYKSIAVRDVWSTCPNCGIEGFNNTYIQSHTVPGPLPLLGVGAAFSYSRRLRNRLKVRAEA